MRRWLLAMLFALSLLAPLGALAASRPGAIRLFLPHIAHDSPAGSVTPTRSATVTASATATATSAASASPTATETPTVTASPTPSATASASPTPTASPSPTTTSTPSPTPTALPPMEVLSVHRYVDVPTGQLHFVGEVRNNTSRNQTFVRITLTLRQAGQAVYSATVFSMLSTLRPGELSPFDFAMTPPPPYDSYGFAITSQPTDRDPVDDFAILSQRSFTDTLTTLAVVGELRNDLPSAVAFVVVVGTFYDSQGAVWNAGQVYTLLDRLAAGQRSPFRLAVSGAPQIVSYTLKVRAAPNVPPPRADLIVVNSTPNVQESLLTIDGQVRNDGAVGARDVEVVATLYDAAGQVVNAAAGPANPTTLPAGASHPFQILFPSNWQGYTRYELQGQGLDVTSVQ